MNIEEYPCVQINCPEWFARKDFVAWLREGAVSTESPVATWYRPRPDEVPDEYSDTFITYDHGEGSDAPNVGDFPSELWKKLCEKLGNRYCVIRLTNLEE